MELDGHWLGIILAALFFECKGEDRVIQPPGDVITTEGETLTLGCTFETSDTYSYLFWVPARLDRGTPSFFLHCRLELPHTMQSTTRQRAATKENVTATEGEAVTLGCQYSSSSSNDYLFWYKQDGNNSPKFILSRFKIGEGKTKHEFRDRFSSTLNSKIRSVPLKISSAKLSDSAVYYCALRPTVTGKMQSTTRQRAATNRRCDCY
ncbi:uncharacterized protein LOC116685423 [Etheostoma spectabile]|uniref:uncharacterized protein LOC116685423 n=1 Tax=Etheostoma spectabile TaxID=54343 RepID=UPI0013AEA1EC|nr:uncharacterized protein LOC116685423 [Etheostoma spectabile]